MDKGMIRENCRWARQMMESNGVIYVQQHMVCDHRYPREAVMSETTVNFDVPSGSSPGDRIKFTSPDPESHGDIYVILKEHEKPWYKKVMDF